VFFPVCSINNNLDQRRKLTMTDYADGKYLGSTDEHVALGNQTYNGLLLSVQRRAANGITVNANYTLSKCTGHPTQGGTTPNVNSGYVDPDNIDYDYGAVTPTVVTCSIYGQRQTGVQNTTLRLASDWRLSGSSAPTPDPRFGDSGGRPARTESAVSAQTRCSRTMLSR
jgi:hypothetical protein